VRAGGFWRCLTTKFSDPAHEMRGLQPRRDGRVRCSAWLGRVVMTCSEICPMTVEQRRALGQQEMSAPKAARDAQAVHQCHSDSRRERTARATIRRAPNMSDTADGRLHGACAPRSQKGRVCNRPVLCAWNSWRVERPNDPSSATRPARRHDCNRDAMAGFAAAHG